MIILYVYYVPTYVYDYLIGMAKAAEPNFRIRLLPAHLCLNLYLSIPIPSSNKLSRHFGRVHFIPLHLNLV